MVEYRQWLSAAQSIQPAIDKLDEVLEKLKQRPKDSEAAAKASEQKA
jgi:ribosome-associated translation inhibitor RaiA